MKKKMFAGAVCALVVVQLGTMERGFTHGDVTSQAVDTEGLDPLPEEIEAENPYRLREGP